MQLFSFSDWSHMSLKHCDCCWWSLWWLCALPWCRYIYNPTWTWPMTRYSICVKRLGASPMWSIRRRQAIEEFRALMTINRILLLQISSIFYYLCVVTLQFAAPLILCLYLTLMYKSLGGFSWAGIFKETVVLQHECAADAEVTTLPVTGAQEFNIMESAQSLQASFSSLKNVNAQLILIIIIMLTCSLYSRCSPRRSTRVSSALPPGGATLHSLPLPRWALSTSRTSIRHKLNPQIEFALTYTKTSSSRWYCFDYVM